MRSKISRGHKVYRVRETLTLSNRWVYAAQSLTLILSCDPDVHSLHWYCRNLQLQAPRRLQVQRGHADYTRVPSHFVFKIPDALSSEMASPVVRSGITTFSLLKRNGCGPTKYCLGYALPISLLFSHLSNTSQINGKHFGALVDKALKTDKVIAISRKSNKEADAPPWRADVYIMTGDGPN